MKKTTGKQGCFVFFCVLFFFFACRRDHAIVYGTEFALGTLLTIRVYEGGAKEDIEKAFEEVRKIEQQMSISVKDYKHTELLDLNALSVKRKGDAFEYTVSDATYEVVRASAEMAKKTNGAFDPTVAPLVTLWGFGSNHTKVPSEKEIQTTIERVGWQGLSIKDKNKIMLVGGREIDVGGIAKGYASDRAAEILTAAGVRRAIIDFGGNIRTIGETKAGGDKWSIGIQDPYASVGKVVGTLKVGESSIVTSGVYERYFEKDGKKYFHLLNATTGYPVRNGLQSVTIVKRNGMEADGLSTAVFVMGLDKGWNFIRQEQNTEAIFITDTKKIYVSEGLEENFEILSSHYTRGVFP